MERTEAHDDSPHVIDITRDTTNGTKARNTPLTRNSGYMIAFEFVMRMGQIIAVIVVMSKSKREHTHVALCTWVIGYACSCAATFPLLLWRFYHPDDSISDRTNYTIMPVSLQVFHLVLACFFLAWLGFAGVLILKEGSSVSDAPNLYRLFYVLLFCGSLPAAVLLFLQCITSVLGFRDHNHGNNSGPHECTTQSRVVAAGTINEHLLSENDEV